MSRRKRQKHIKLEAPRAIRVVFLDIDGVLINEQTKTVPDPACIAALNSLTTITDAYIVVSSVRRVDKDIAGVLAGWGVTGRVLGCTPDLSRMDGEILVGAPRESEIRAWLINCLDVHSYVVLDDDTLDLGDLQDRHVKTEFETGLTIEHARRAVTMLTVRMSRKYVYDGGVIDVHPTGMFFGEWWVNVRGHGDNLASQCESFTDVKLAHAKIEEIAAGLGWQGRYIREGMIWRGAVHEPDMAWAIK